MRSEPPPDPLQGGGGVVGITCLFVTYVGNIYLWKFDVHRSVHRNVNSIVNQADAPVSQIHLF
jgi:hypothetical protein